MILLYANEDEVRYVDYEPKRCIGIYAHILLDQCFFPNFLYGIPFPKEFILFGCSGWRGSRKAAKYNRLYKWRPDSPYLVDMESKKVYDECKKHNIKFTSIRYIIDLDRGKVMPTGINHFWRKFQHRRMQLKFNKYLENLK